MTNCSSHAAQRMLVEQSLRAAFVGGAAWPIDPGGLTALVDMGYSDQCIADSFGVTADEVQILRAEYGLRVATMPA